MATATLPLPALAGADRYKNRYIIAVTVSLASVLELLDALVFWRIIQGLGGGALLSTSQAILYEEFPREEYGTAMAIFGVGVMVGPTLGPTLGGYITDAFGWPWIFYINIPIGMLALALSLSFIQDSRFQQKAERVDYVGLVLLAAGIGTLQTMLERGERLDWFESREVVTYA